MTWLAGAIGVAGTRAAEARGAVEDRGAAPYQISVMLWTVFKKLPVAKRLEKVAEAGYSNVELVGEYKKWSEAEFREAKAKRKELKLHFDVTAGLKQRGVWVHAGVPHTVRACTHLDVSAAQAERAAETIRQTMKRLTPAL